ncbi:histidine acid phosphatase family protein (macronuclear) [Tetrahymena thermophila SB210]|uniref:Histidine acid phosphatase family protein n=1 Tax=Tetrahymena thermophila (strain SB210) TaxID=312017 RepID=I7MFN8_TETTS|nr:histidine acid phosphatase family protein [Tetrahymena thermophila SB210]EAR84078.3 histidine acid phosphatase family protein [Tetrahymena thermophila SB210]|eukprot:XP_001031741.3 histidine acid phosphatase family protein [Tetrahymena thermophila SB210]
MYWKNVSNIRKINSKSKVLQKASTVTQLITLPSQIGSLYVLNSNDFGVCNPTQNSLSIYQYSPTVQLKFQQNINCVSMAGNTYILLTPRLRYFYKIHLGHRQLKAYQIMYADTTSIYYNSVLYNIDIPQGTCVGGPVQGVYYTSNILAFGCEQTIFYMQNQISNTPGSTITISNVVFQANVPQSLTKIHPLPQTKQIITQSSDNNLGFYKIDEVNYSITFQFFKALQISPDYIQIINFNIVIISNNKLQIYAIDNSSVPQETINNPKSSNFMSFYPAYNANYLIAYDYSNNVMRVDLSTSFTCFPNCLTCFGTASYQCGSCVKGYFYNPTASSCSQCKGTCLTCTSLTTCQTCQAGSYLNSSSTCVSCSIGCSSCNQSGCLQCTDSKASVNSSKVCVCQSGFYLDSNGVCQACSLGCSTCNQSGCLQCSDSKASPDSNKVCVCQDGFYLDSNGVCQACNATCKTCSNKNVCTSCDSLTQFRELDLPTNTCTCLSGYTQVAGQVNCQKCISPCIVCTSLSACYTCQSGYYLNSSYSCTPCSVGCSNCNSSGCLQCSDSKASPNSNKVCVCQDGFYLDSNGVCQACNATCKTCSNKNVCTSCDSLTQFRELDLPTNTCTCLSGYTQVAGQVNCQKCISPCIVCTSLSACQTCQSGYYLNSSQSCTPCSVGCSNCNSSGCLLCSDSKAQPDSNKVCVCQNGYYLDSNGVCKACSIGCSKCNSSGCLQCSDSKAQPDSNKVCVCQNGYYLDSNGVCKACSIGCSKCNQNGCLQCSDINAQPNANNLCICKDGQYLDNNGICQSCNSTCLTCSNKNVCTSCNSLVQFRQLDSLTSTCICQQGYSEVAGSDICKQNNQQCQISYCQICQNTNICIQCQKSYYIFLNTCVSTCPQGYEPNQINQCILVMKIYYQITEFESNKFFIQFDQNLTNINQFSKNVNVDVLSFSGKYSFQSQIISDNTIIVTISPNSVPSSQNYTISFMFDQNSQSNLFSYTQQVSGFLTYQASGTTEKATEAIGNAAEVASKATIASLLPLAISGNFQFIASAVDVSQLIYLMNFINLDFPYNLDSFYNSVKDVKIPFENFFELIEDFHEVEYKSPEKFEFKKIQGFYLENFGEYLSLIITILMTNFIVYLIEMGLRIKPVWQKYINLVRTKVFTFNIYFEFLFVIYIELAIAIVLQVQQFQYNHHVAEIVNYILLSIGIIISLIPIALIYLIYNKKLTNQIHSISDNSSFQYYYPIQYIRKYYYSIVIGGFGFSPFVQLICLNVWNLFMLCLVIKTKPNKHKSYNYRDIISSFFFLTSTSLLFLFMVPKFSNEESQMLLGWIVIGNLIFIIMLELGFFVKEVLTKVFQLLKHAKEKLQKRENQIALNKVVPMSPTTTKQENQNICEDSLQKDQMEEVKLNNKKPPLSRPGLKRPMNVSIKQQNSNSTHDAVERQEISVLNESPTKTQRPSPLPSSSNLRGNSSTFNLIPSNFQKSSSSLKPPSFQFDRKSSEQQSEDFRAQGQESQNMQGLQNIIDKDIASSERVLMASPESKLRSLTLKNVDKSVSGIENGLEYIPIIQSSEILKNFVQDQQPSDRKRIEKPQFSKANKNGHRRVMEKLKSFHVNFKDEK